ncbi:MAG: MFS transporter [Immundisolibacter sp.]|uniref:MFS transporter n=1 Tax=Immundisolibacter sp. TaxID=1934948 RepID=UPI003D135409
MADAATSLQAQLDARPMSALQWRVVALCWLVNMLDGFDLLAISFAAPAIAKAWQLDPKTLGIVFSSGLVGMTIGSFVLGPAADRIGRRRMILIATTVLGLSTLLTAAAGTVAQLMTLRVFTGLAIGALLPSLNTLVAEYTPDARRNLAIAFMHLGYPVGGIAGGFLAGQLIPTFGWPAVFVAGGVFTLATLPLLLFGLPESLHYLGRSVSPRARRRAEQIAATLGIRLGAAPDTATNTAPVRVADLLRGHWLAPSLALWACFFLGNLTLYFLLNWTPTVLVEAGVPSERAIGAGMLLNLGGGIGMLALGHLSARWPMHPMMCGFFVLGGLLIMAIGQASGAVNVLFALTVLAGFFALGGLIGLYSLAARLYPDSARATGVGLALGAGRFGAILGPYTGGVLISLGWPMGRYFLLLALPLVAAGLIVWRVRQPA